MSIQRGEPTEWISSGTSDLRGAGKGRAVQKMAKAAGRGGSGSRSQSDSITGVDRGTELSVSCITLRRIQIIIVNLGCRLQIREDGAG